MAVHNPYDIPGRCMHLASIRSLTMLRSLGVELRKGFYATDVPQIIFQDLTRSDDEPIELGDFRGRLTLGNGMLVSRQSPFHADGLRITLVRWGRLPEQCGKLATDDSVCLSECSIVSYLSVRIEERVLFGPGAIIMDCDGAPADPRKPRGVDNLHMAPIVIEHDAWVGAHAIILPGVRIGHHATVSANAVVAQDIPPHGLAVGNPATVAAVFTEPLPAGAILSQH
jgi:acetyltransferase-like isoleucine patch superfamily enzyme